MWNEGRANYWMTIGLPLNSISRERGSRKNPTSGVSLSLPASGKSFCSGMNE